MNNKPLKDLTDDEINRLAAELCGFTEYDKCYVYDKDEEFLAYSVCLIEEWQPTKDANQIQKYLFPKLIDNGIFPLINYQFESITFFGMPNFHMYWELETINRTTVEACIEAMWKIKETDGE